MNKPKSGRGGGGSDVFSDAELVQWWRAFNKHAYNEEITPWLRSAFWFAGTMLATGMRLNEARQVLVGDCSTYPAATADVQNGKGGKFRTVDVLPQFVPHWEWLVTESKRLGRYWLFESQRYTVKGGGKHPLSVRAAAYWWDEAIKAAGLRRLTTHAARRTFTTYAPRIPYQGSNGHAEYMSLKSLQEQLGHSDLKTTLGHYLRDMPGYRFPRDTTFDWPAEVCPQKSVPNEREEEY